MEVRSNLLEKLVGEVKKTSTGVQRDICNEYEQECNECNEYVMNV